MNPLELKDIQRTFADGTHALRGIDLTVKAGEVVALLGKNGAGKTTLIQVAMGRIHPQAGEVRVFGLDHNSHSIEIKSRIGFVSEEQLLPPFLKAREVIEMHRAVFPKWDRGLEEQLTKRFDIPMTRKIIKLSKGQARQVAVLCAVAHRPELLILDEPAGGLDPAARREFLEVAIESLQDLGSTILFSSHHMQDVERIASRVVMIHKGRVLLDRELDDLREDLSLVVLTPNGTATDQSIRQMRGCLATRTHAGQLRAVFEGRAGVAPDQLSASDATTSKLGLEDLFIEIVEGQVE